jgi:hypothetical protein
MLGKYVQGYPTGVRLCATYSALQFNDMWTLYADKSIQPTLNLKCYTMQGIKKCDKSGSLVYRMLMITSTLYTE